MYALRCQSEELMRFLLAKGIDINFKDSHGWTVSRQAFEGHCKK
jgi:ankyrin repeat protein